VAVSVVVTVGVRHVVGVSVVIGVMGAYVSAKVHVTVWPGPTATLLNVLATRPGATPDSSLGAPPVAVPHVALVSCQSCGNVSEIVYVPAPTFMPLVSPLASENAAGSGSRFGGCSVAVDTVNANWRFVGSGDGEVTTLTTSVPNGELAMVIARF
jgi:hypothetical protein